MPPRQPLDLAEELAKLAAVLEKAQKRTFTGGGVRSGSRVATTESQGSQRRRIRRESAPATGQVQRIRRTHRECPGVIIAARETRVREDLTTLPAESWSWQRHAKGRLLHHCGHFLTLRRVIVMVAGALNEGRIGGFERQHAMLYQIYRILESGAKETGHGLALVVAAGRTVRPRRPNRHPLVTLRSFSSCRLTLESSCKETVDGTHWQGNAQSQERAPLRRRRHFAVADSRRGKADPSGETARTWRQGREGQRRRGKLRLSRNLHVAGPARYRGRAHCFPRDQNGWPLFFFFHTCLHEICQRGDGHSSFPSHLLAASDPDASQPTPSRALQPPRGTSRDCRPSVVLSRTAQQWRSEPS